MEAWRESLWKACQLSSVEKYLSVYESNREIEKEESWYSNESYKCNRENIIREEEEAAREMKRKYVIL